MSRSLAIGLSTLAVLSLAFIFDHGLWTPDEPRDAEIGREIGMSAVPRLNQEPFLEKPPLYFWTVGASYSIFGVSPWASRVPSILFGWGTLLFTFLLARRMFGQEAPLYSVLILGTMVMFLDITHKCTVDNALVFFTTGTVYWLYKAEGKLWRYLVAYGFALGAFMSKGMAGLALIAPAFLVFLLWTKQYREILRAQPWFAVLIVGAGAAAWLACLTPELRDVFIVDNHLGRFTGKNYSGGHVRPVWYYLTASLYAFSPWTLALIPAVAWALKPDDAVDKRFLLSWLGVGFLVLTIASTKREIYMLPLLPGAAILIGGWFQRVTQRPKWANGLLFVFAGLLVLGHLTVWTLALAVQNWVGLGVSIAVAAVASFLVIGRVWPYGLALATASLMLGGVFVAVPSIDAAKNVESFCRKLPDRVSAIDPDETTLGVIPYYSGRYIEKESPYVVVTLKRASDKLPEGYDEVMRHEPAPLDLFGRKIRMTDRTMVLLKRRP